MMRRWSRAAVAAATLLSLVPGARPAYAAARVRPAPNQVTSLSIVPGTGAAQVVISVAGSVEVNDFTLENPRRIVLDLKGATLGISARTYDKVARGGIMNIRYAQRSPDVVRVVLDLDATREYTVVRGEKDVTVNVVGPASFAAWHVGGKVQPKAPLASVTGIAAAPAVVAPVVAAPAVVTEPAPVVAAPAATKVAPAPVTRKADAPAPVAKKTDAPAPVAKRVELAPAPVVQDPDPEPVRVKAEPRPAPTKVGARSQNKAEPAVGDEAHITVSYQETNIRDVITAFAKFSNRTIIIGKQVDGIFTGDIIDKPWDVALRQILQSQGLAALEDATGIITVDSYTNLADREKVEPLLTKVIQVNYAKADAMATTVRSLLTAGCGGGGSGGAAAAAQAAAGAAAGGGSSASCSTRGAVTSEEKTNTIIITETAQRLADIESYIKDLDVRTPQVSIKAKIIAVDRTGTEQLGISYDLGSANGFSNSVVQHFDASGAPVAGDYRVNLAGDAFAAVANASRPYKGTASTSLIYNMALGGFNLTSFLDALSSVQLSDVQAEPSTTTVDNKEARLFAGSTLSFLLTPPVPAGQITSVAPQIQTREIGIELKVTPHVTANRQVLLDVYANHETISAITSAGPSTNKRNSTNQVLVGDGETAVIGGLTQTQVTLNKTGIPILMDLPLIGRLFSSTDKLERKQDLLILITPHIVDDGEVVRPGKPQN
ncbi:MAG: AMIN domain-containing protein [Gemmatimonadetes bacterium]|nr:AMIN domain-containing protein [Gemmatimonadota bacterium]